MWKRASPAPIHGQDRCVSSLRQYFRRRPLQIPLGDDRRDIEDAGLQGALRAAGMEGRAAALQGSILQCEGTLPTPLLLWNGPRPVASENRFTRRQKSTKARAFNPLARWYSLGRPCVGSLGLPAC